MSEDNKSFGRICVFFARSCGTCSAIMGTIPRCIPTGLLLIACAVVMFFLEAAVLGYCFERMSFLVKVGHYANNWVRFVVYLIFALIPVFLWCISASTLVCLGLFFIIAAINFILAIGMKGEHSSSYEKVTLSDLNRLETGAMSGTEEENEKTALPTVKDTAT